jgi:transglutaminase-like putative cysteine protease
MSRLRIIHGTVYRYSEPVEFGRHRLVIRPREGHDLRVEELKLTIAPAHRVTWRRDLFGNSIAFVDFLEEADRLEIINETVVALRDSVPLRTLADFAAVPWPAIYADSERPVASGYQMPVYFDEAVELKAWLAAQPDVAAVREATRLVQILNDWIYEHIQYRRREERGVQSPLQTLQLGSGSCRDMATLLLELVRAAGLAARFASGYLNSEASIAGRAATHAWIEVYFPEQGWCGCDPTLGEETSPKHILTGVSSHPRGVMPISGFYSGDPQVYLGLDVSVRMEKLVDEGAFPTAEPHGTEARRGEL